MTRIATSLLLAIVILLGLTTETKADSLLGIDLGQSWTVSEIKSGKANGDPDISALKFALQKMETKVFFADDRASFVIALDATHKTGYQCTGVTIFRGMRQALTEADKLNGIQGKWGFHFVSKAFREAKSGKWSDWRNGKPNLSAFVSVNVQLKGGKFVVVPPDDYSKLQRWVVK